MTEALHCSADKCMHYCYTADEHPRNMTVQNIQEHDNGVQTLPKLDTWWLFAVFEFTLDTLHTPSLDGLPLVQAVA